MKVLKFGSSALSSPDNVSRVKTIIEKYDGPVVVVTAAALLIVIMMVMMTLFYLLKEACNLVKYHVKKTTIFLCS